MKTFIVHAKNRPGEMATLTGALSSRDVNVLITALGVQLRLERTTVWN